MEQGTQAHDTMKTDAPTERHPLSPFIPEGARILMLGSFPPKKERWSMEFFYPNFTNDMWRIVGLVFFGDRRHFERPGEKRFDKERIVRFCEEKGIALYDSASGIRRLKDNASDKFLEIVSATDIRTLLDRMPECRAVVTTGEKATEAVAEYLGCATPKTGQCLQTGGLDFWRMPSSSRAYPLPLERKAEAYRQMFAAEGILSLSQCPENLIQ